MREWYQSNLGDWIDIGTSILGIAMGIALIIPRCDIYDTKTGAEQKIYMQIETPNGNGTVELDNLKINGEPIEYVK